MIRKGLKVKIISGKDKNKDGEVIEEVSYGLQDLFDDPNAQYVALACKPYVDELVDFEKGCWKEDE